MRVLHITACLSILTSLGLCGSQIWAPRGIKAAENQHSPADVLQEIQKGWSLHPVRTLPESVTTLMVADDERSTLKGCVYAGTTGSAGIYRINPLTSESITPLANGMGDSLTFGTCHVNRLALHDLDGDGEPEMLGTTSQVHPRGIPRLYVWSSAVFGPALRAVARPEIKSSWSHSLDFLPRPGQTSDSIFVTFCGFGEVVEYRWEPQHEPTSFQRDTLGWKVVGKLPASGEWLQIVDADNDGKQDICVATGFSLGNAAVIFYASDTSGATLRETRRLDEGRRFGNVRFLAGPIEGDGGQDIIAWWCTDLSGGDAEVIVYHVGSGGVERRNVIAKGPAADLWADDDRFTLADVDEDGRKEVWFTTGSGNLWRYDPAHSRKVELMARFRPGLGPVVGGPAMMEGHQKLYLAWDRQLFSFDPTALSPLH